MHKQKHMHADKKCRKPDILNQITISMKIIHIRVYHGHFAWNNCLVNAKKSEKKTSSSFTVKWAHVWCCKKKERNNNSTSKWPYPKKRTRIAAIQLRVCMCVCAVVNCSTHCVKAKSIFQHRLEEKRKQKKISLDTIVRFVVVWFGFIWICCCLLIFQFNIVPLNYTIDI